MLPVKNNHLPEFYATQSASFSPIACITLRIVDTDLLIVCPHDTEHNPNAGTVAMLVTREYPTT